MSQKKHLILCFKNFAWASKSLFLSLLITLGAAPLNSHQFSKTYIYHPHKNHNKNHTKTLLWECTKCDPFTECIFSWNARRPLVGQLSFKGSLLVDGTWSPLQKFATWALDEQRSFGFGKKKSKAYAQYVRFDVQKKHKATGLKFEVCAEDGAQLNCVNQLCAATSTDALFRKKNHFNKSSILLRDIELQSQHLLKHHRCPAFCSPTATMLLVRYLKRTLGKKNDIALDQGVVRFAEKVYDNGALHIYGNWLFNVAQAYHELDGKVNVRVERLNSFKDLYHYLHKGIPVPVSVRGEIASGTKPYTKGHFVLVIGWDNTTKEVVLIDSDHKKNEDTLRRCPLDSFLTAWA